MNTGLFLEELTRVFDKSPKPEQLRVYHDKLRRFSAEQLIEILNRVIEEARYFPKVSEIFKAASELGYLAIDTTRTQLHHWTPTDCPTCRGEGRVAVFWEFGYENRDSGRVEIQRLVKVLQYTKSFDYVVPADQFRTVFRCKCAAAEARTIPKHWPRLSKQTPLQREVWL